MKIFLDDERKAPAGWIQTRTVEETIEILKSQQVSDLSLDNDLGIGYSEGYEVLDWLEEWVYNNPTFPIPNIRVHTSNPTRRYYMNGIIRKLYTIRDAQIPSTNG